MKKLLDNHKKILIEAAVVERLRRLENVSLHKTLVNANFIYEKSSKEELFKVFMQYANIAYEAKLPLLLCTPTWRANKQRVNEATNIPNTINEDNVKELQAFRNSLENKDEVFIGGLMGCKNDCYKPEEALDEKEALEFHSWQAQKLASSGVDFLVAETLPSVKEALGIAKACEQSKKPYIISFVISKDGRMLDGSSLLDAISFIDENTKEKPLGYMVNCAYPSFLNASLQDKKLFERLIGYQANASSLEHCDLDDSCELKQEPLDDWVNLMLELNTKFGIKIIGGCCGTDEKYLRAIAN